MIPVQRGADGNQKKSNNQAGTRESCCRDGKDAFDL